MLARAGLVGFPQRSWDGAVFATQSWGKEEEEKDSWSCGISLPESPVHVMEPGFPRNG